MIIDAKPEYLADWSSAKCGDGWSVFVPGQSYFWVKTPAWARAVHVSTDDGTFIVVPSVDPLRLDTAATSPFVVEGAHQCPRQLHTVVPLPDPSKQSVGFFAPFSSTDVRLITIRFLEA